MNKEPLISVIVPIYKVEAYLDDCVESIIRQTYSNLEIILVDDGSPDGCPQMCDEWAKKDERIRVVHKKNGGLSSARNAGLEVATGEYIGFVDSDDYIAPFMYADLLSAFERGKDVAITCCMIMAFDEDGREYTYKERWTVASDILISHKEFFIDMLFTEVAMTVWSKLYRADVIGNIRFKEGRNNEDTLYNFEVSHVLEQKGMNMLTIPSWGYYYRMREGSICNDAKTPLQIDILLNLQEMEEYYKAHNDTRCQMVREIYSQNLTDFCISLLFHPNWKKRFFDKYYSDMCKLKFRDIVGGYRDRHNMIAHFLMFKYMPSIYTKLKLWKGE